MAELWNRVNIAFPSAVSSVRIHFSSTTDAKVKSLLVENQNALKLIRSEILEREIRVLYELLYVLNNSSRGNKTFKALKQVEQCINRLKIMKLDVALQDLTELCPNKIQRVLSIKTGEGDVPSQPFLEWLCLKVLGGAQLMSCTLDRCSRAFILSKKHMKLEVFIILNIVITSMLSRLWVIFRGILVSLSVLYQYLLELHREVAGAKPMPFLPDFSLPADITQVLGYTDAFLRSRLSAQLSHGREKKQSKKTCKVKNMGKTRRVKEDLGVAIERGGVLNTDLKPFLSVIKGCTKEKYRPQAMHRADKENVFEKQVQEAATVTDLMTPLKEAMEWCKSQKKKKEKGFLAFVYLKCQRLKGLEAAGYNVQRKLVSLKREVRWALSPQGPAPRTCRSASKMWREAHQKKHFHSLGSLFKSWWAVRAGVSKKQTRRQRKRTGFTASPISGDAQKHRTASTAASQTADDHRRDDIDDIFASVGL
ncbi:nucleolus and neural progenitor protein [Brachionichthys hirsutus]|uniref:nucleolus and neural progenitor protein n=1 Tax=Brachionichthys hirsutus TaxID=412623 RepID=UPI0036053D0D